MSEAKHTPGPWSVFKPKGKSSRGIGPSAELIVARATPCFYEGMHHAMANASLIAAAPDLLEALMSLMWSNHAVPCWCAVPERDGHDDACMKVKAAIAKAEGQI